MKDIRVDHIAIAVPDLAQALTFWADQLGLEEIATEIVEEQGVRVAKLDIGNTHIELLEPLSPETPVGKFIAKKGPGLHHICVGVAEIESELSNLKAQGTRLIDESPRLGAGGHQIAFVHPQSTGGVLLELSSGPDGPLPDEQGQNHA